MTTTFRDLNVKGTSGSYADGTDFLNASVSTANGSATNLISIPLAQGEGVIIEGHVAGFKSDMAAGAFRHIACGFRRAVAGNVTSLGTAQGTTVEDSAGTPTVTVNANTTTQACEIQVTGIAAETWKWEGNFRITKIK